MVQGLLGRKHLEYVLDRAGLLDATDILALPNTFPQVQLLLFIPCCCVGKRHHTCTRQICWMKYLLASLPCAPLVSPRHIITAARTQQALLRAFAKDTLCSHGCSQNPSVAALTMRFILFGLITFSCKISWWRMPATVLPCLPMIGCATPELPWHRVSPWTADRCPAPAGSIGLGQVTLILSIHHALPALRSDNGTLECTSTMYGLADRWRRSSSGCGQTMVMTSHASMPAQEHSSLASLALASVPPGDCWTMASSLLSDTMSTTSRMGASRMLLTWSPATTPSAKVSLWHSARHRTSLFFCAESLLLVYVRSTLLQCACIAALVLQTTGSKQSLRLQ